MVWTPDELGELVREGRNLALSARTSMGLTYDRDPTMMCDLSGRLLRSNFGGVVRGQKFRKTRW